MHLNFWLYKSKTSKKGLAPVYLRITLGGERAEISTGVSIAPCQWNSKKGLVKGSSTNAKELNTRLQQLSNNVLNIHNEFLKTEIPLSAEGVKSRFLGGNENKITLLHALTYHNELLRQKIGKGNTKATYTKYETVKSKVGDYIRARYGRSDLFLKELNRQFITGFELFLKTEHGLGNNTAMKYLQQLKKVIHLCISQNWLEQNPFITFKCNYNQVHRGYLDKKEILRLESKKFSFQRLEDVKNIFLFACYTGLSYVDVAALTRNNLTIKEDGSIWIIIHRHKTGTRSPIPLLPQAQAILNKYTALVAKKNEELIPMISNQKTNAYLKEIGQVCGIEKNLTFHLARHTFATTITLTNGVPIETVSKMLGHTSLKTTQIYAKVVDIKIQEDMKALAEKLSRNQT